MHKKIWKLEDKLKANAKYLTEESEYSLFLHLATAVQSSQWSIPCDSRRQCRIFPIHFLQLTYKSYFFSGFVSEL